MSVSLWSCLTNHGLVLDGSKVHTAAISIFELELPYLRHGRKLSAINDNISNISTVPVSAVICLGLSRVGIGQTTSAPTISQPRKP